MEKIKLYNRCLYKIYLKWVVGNKYELIIDGVDYIRLGFTDKTNEFSFIDPAGGPFMMVNNFTVNGRVLRSIKQEIVDDKVKYYLIFEKDGN